MKISIGFVLSALLSTLFTILAVCIYCENQQYEILQRQVAEASIEIQDANFHPNAINKMKHTYPNISITKQNEYIYYVNATYSYDIPTIFFHDKRSLHTVLYQGGWQ